MSRSFIQRVIDRLPGSKFVWGTVIALVPVAAASLPDAYIATVGEDSLAGRVLAGAVFSYAVALSLFAVAYFDRRVREVRRSLSKLTPSDVDLDPFAGYASIVGPLLLTAAFVVATVGRTIVLTDLETGLAWLPISIVTNVPLMSAFWLYLVVLLGLRRLSRFDLSLETFPEDPSLGLAPAGRLASTAFWIFVAASTPILVVNAGYTLRLILTFGVFIVGVFSFFASVWGLHRQLLRAREEHIAHARHLYAQAYAEVRSGSVESLGRHAHSILAAKAVEDEARSIQRWPFEDRRFREIAAIVGTVVTFTGTGIFTRLIYENVIL
jgi:hypothetical protein